MSEHLSETSRRIREQNGVDGALVVLVGGEKGGSNKTTVATNLACYAASRRLKVALIDADPKPASYNFLLRRAKNEQPVPAITPLRVRGDIERTIESAALDHDVVIIDCGGMDSDEQRAALIQAHRAIFPFLPSTYDLDTCQQVNKIIGQAKKFNARLQSMAVISSAPTNDQGADTRDAKEFFGHFEHLPLASTIINQLKVFRDTAKTGIGVVETTNGKAKAQIQLLGQEVLHV